LVIADKDERFVASFLRLNGFFTVPSFIVHAGEGRARPSGGQAGSHTEVGRRTSNDPHVMNNSLQRRDQLGEQR
jgi:hypothetical protein